MIIILTYNDDETEKTETDVVGKHNIQKNTYFATWVGY